jgi:phage terminase large subunit
VTPALLLAALLAAAPSAPARAPDVRPAPQPELQQSAGANPPFDPSVEEAVAALMVWHDDPVVFVRQVFGAVPDEWQGDGLRATARELRIAYSACKGPGKSCTLAWTIWWFLATREDAQVICTSISKPNLKDNLWKELAVWHAKSPYLQRTFEMGAERIVQKERPKTWWCSARGWAQDADATRQADTLAGFHGQHVLIVLDEVGGYPDGVVVAAEGIFANVVDAKLVVAGNPTDTNGPLYRITSKDRKRWAVTFITGDPEDPKRSPRISIEWARQMIEDWGRDNDWVRVNVLGLFPRVAADKLIGPDDINLAIQRTAMPRDFGEEPKVMGLDVAQFGDDRSVLTMRQGVMVWEPTVWRGLGPTELLERVSVVVMKHQPDAVFVAVTGGYGQSVFEGLLALGVNAIAVDEGGGASSPRFRNKRAEIWWNGCAFTKKYACLPNDSELGSELCLPTYSFGTSGKRTTFKIQAKDELKALYGASPDKADSYLLTFAQPVAKRDWTGFGRLTNERAREAQDYQPAIG